MFAPWCPTCSQHTLLGPRRVESIENGAGPPRVALRCFCGTLLHWPPAAEEAVAAPLARPVDHRDGPGACEPRAGATAVPA